jgi:hypothetical protein
MTHPLEAFLREREPLEESAPESLPPSFDDVCESLLRQAKLGRYPVLFEEYHRRRAERERAAQLERELQAATREVQAQLALPVRTFVATRKPSSDDDVAIAYYHPGRPRLERGSLRIELLPGLSFVPADMFEEVRNQDWKVRFRNERARCVLLELPREEPDLWRALCAGCERAIDECETAGAKHFALETMRIQARSFSGTLQAFFFHILKNTDSRSLLLGWFRAALAIEESNSRIRAQLINDRFRSLFEFDLMLAQGRLETELS